MYRFDVCQELLPSQTILVMRGNQTQTFGIEVCY